MKQFVFIGFFAIAWDDKGEEYEAPFAIGFPNGAVSREEMDNKIYEQKSEFFKLHPNGKIVQQFQRVVNVR